MQFVLLHSPVFSGRVSSELHWCLALDLEFESFSSTNVDLIRFERISATRY